MQRAMSGPASFANRPVSSLVRQSFLDHFQGRGHTICESAPIIPQNDPTLMFTNAGMVPFKDVFTGKDKRPFTRATSSQKCIRISGKHNDLENVGVTARHHTFFEMLGNFSFGDYFKEEAIVSAWDLITKTWEIPQEKLVITVFGGAEGLGPDDEARALWRKVTGFGDERIIGLGMKDNFWQMGDVGPCGPCTEIHFFHGDDPDPKKILDEPLPDGRGWMEIWNLVFMQYERSLGADGSIIQKSLPKPSVDTGAGLERVSAVLQGKTSNYEGDLLRSLVEKAAEIAKKPYGGTQGNDDVSMRVIADHARTTAFLVAEGIFPDRAGREYVLRRVMRRAIRHGHRLGIAKPFLHEVAGEVVRLMGDAYPELTRRKDVILAVAEQEEVRFRETIDRGLKLLDEEVQGMTDRGETVIRGDVAFKLNDTYGFPLDLTEVIAAERNLTVDHAGFEGALAAQKAKSAGSKLGDEALADIWRAVAEKVGVATTFLGYESEAGEGTVKAIVVDGALVESASAGAEITLICDATPFYAESGGQMGDAGTATDGDGLRIAIDDTQKPHGGVHLHHARVSAGVVRVGQKVALTVDHARRSATRRNHSATHLLHWALRTVLGDQATQKGSLVSADRLRFDFSWGKPLTEAELTKIEDLVNGKILANAPVITEVLKIEEARSRGAMAMFGEKYGEVVRVLTMTEDSVEFCGGTHAAALGDIGLFKILSEGGVAAGVRRVECATGENAIAYVRDLEGTLKKAARTLKSATAEIPTKVEKLLDQTKLLEKEVAELKKKLALGGGGAGGGDELDGAFSIEGGRVLAVRRDGLDPASLREVAEKLRDKLGEGIVFVASAGTDKVALVVAVSKGMTARYKAGELAGKAAVVVGGKGGGRPDLAQAGGPDVTKIDEALTAFKGLFA
jgi:alanyl-tRNA synthetase